MCPPLPPPKSFARPSGKSIYNQRKDYSQALLKPHTEFRHHVEHLLTVRLEGDIRSPEDCLERLRALEAQGRVWGQDLILQVKGQELVLRDVESEEELEVHPLGSVQGCSAALDACGYDSVLAIKVQEPTPPGTSVLLFQCERVGAEALRSSLEKLVKQWKEEQRSQYGHRSSLDTPSSLAPPYMRGPYLGLEQRAETPEPDFHMPPPHGLLSSHSNLQDTSPMPRADPPGQVTSSVDRDVDVLNHVLSDLNLFVVRLRAALGSASTHPHRRKKRKDKGALPPDDAYTDFFQKVKYALNLLGKTHRHVQEPSPSELLQLIFVALSFVLEHCPSAQLAPSVEAPLLVPEALELLEQTLPHTHYSTWKGLGMAWNKARAEYPKGELVPRYIPVFSDGWLPPLLEPEGRGGGQDGPPPASVSPSRSGQPSHALLPPPSPAAGWRDHPGQVAPFHGQGLVRVLYEFQGRNMRELSVRMGDTLQVLDQQKKWWLVQDGRGERGYVPSNILEPLGDGWGGPSASQVGMSPPPQESPPSLYPDSSPAEVTAWLKDKGFSRITVRCLGVLGGQQLLQMSPAELRAVCPEEWQRVLFKLSPVRTSLGMGPRD